MRFNADEGLTACQPDPRVTNAFCEMGDTDVLANEPVNVVHTFWGLRGQATSAPCSRASLALSMRGKGRVQDQVARNKGRKIRTHEGVRAPAVMTAISSASRISACCDEGDLIFAKARSRRTAC
jgi:hypothetical protein